MKLIIHGTDLESSRNFYFLQKQKLKNPVILSGEGLVFAEFFKYAQNQSIFDEETSMILENLFSKNKTGSMDVKKIAEFIDDTKNLNIILWEQVELSKTTLSLIKSSQINLFSYPKKLFIFLDQIRPNNQDALIKLYHELRQTQEAEMIFFMLVRQFRLFLSSVENKTEQIDEIKKMAPWQISKLSRQVRFFNKDELLKAYNRLYDMEYGQKTGKSDISLDASIDFFLGGL
ncbi:hypothetical protein M1615_03540 [Patescibacteria group bacterium]|nr:hypothetical protein [Patescibacteria group bacterium]